jgi:hypothetical protein
VPGQVQVCSPCLMATRVAMRTRLPGIYPSLSAPRRPARFKFAIVHTMCWSTLCTATRACRFQSGCWPRWRQRFSSSVSLRGAVPKRLHIDRAQRSTQRRSGRLRTIPRPLPPRRAPRTTLRLTRQPSRTRIPRRASRNPRSITPPRSPRCSKLRSRKPWTRRILQYDTERSDNRRPPRIDST